jgi:hypothetical protein
MRAAPLALSFKFSLCAVRALLNYQSSFRLSLTITVSCSVAVSRKYSAFHEISSHFALQAQEARLFEHTPYAANSLQQTGLSRPSGTPLLCCSKTLLQTFEIWTKSLCLVFFFFSAGCFFDLI